jgi:hypothetical protein
MQRLIVPPGYELRQATSSEVGGSAVHLEHMSMPSLAPSEPPTVTFNSLLARFHDLPLQAALTSTCRYRVHSTCVPLTHQQGLQLQAYSQFIKGVYSDGSELALQEGETCVAHPLDEMNTVLILFGDQSQSMRQSLRLRSVFSNTPQRLRG